MIQRKYPVMEIFGPTIQGEGLQIGTPTFFIRFGGCDYRCKWCDTMYAVDPSQVRAGRQMMSDDDILGKLLELRGSLETRWVTLSGGNPALQHLDTLIPLLHEHGFNVAMETQGTVWRDWIQDVDVLCISPKGPSSEMITDWSKLDQYLLSLNPEIRFVKVPIFNLEDVEFLRAVRKRYPLVDLYASVGNQFAPGSKMAAEFEQISQEELNRILLDSMRIIVETLLHDPELSTVKTTPQAHVLLWGNSKGR